MAEPSPRLSARQHSSEETSQRWRAVGDTVSDWIGPGIEPLTLHTSSDNFNNRQPTDAESQQNSAFLVCGDYNCSV